MDAHHAKELENAPIRAHPWTTAVSNESHAYVDFKANPHLIRNSLEDIEPYKEYRFVEKFYSLIEWINGPNSFLESNDCGFRGVKENIDVQFPFEYRCMGRLMILFRDLAENCQPQSIKWLMAELCSSISKVNPDFYAGSIGLSRMETAYKGLSDDPKKLALGKQIMLTFYAYGTSQIHCYESMEHVIDYAQIALKETNKKIRDGEVDALYR